MIVGRQILRLVIFDNRWPLRDARVGLDGVFEPAWDKLVTNNTKSALEQWDEKFWPFIITFLQVSFSFIACSCFECIFVDLSGTFKIVHTKYPTLHIDNNDIDTDNYNNNYITYRTISHIFLRDTVLKNNSFFDPEICSLSQHFSLS